MSITALVVIPLLISGIVRILTDKYKFPIFKTPIDFNQKIRAKPIFGPSKTWQGLFVMTLVAFGCECLLRYSNIRASILPVGYSSITALLYNLGELINSFIKRQFLLLENGQNLNSKNGGIKALQYLIDQIDGFLTIAIYLYFIGFSWVNLILLLLLGLSLHLAIDFVNHFYTSKKLYSIDISGMVAFYQILIYLALLPLRPFFRMSKLKIDSRIILSNHVSAKDFFVILYSMSLNDYINFCPFCYPVSTSYRKYSWLVQATGGVFNHRKNLFDNDPRTELLRRLKLGYNLLWFWEGRIRYDKIPLPAKQYKSGLINILQAYPEAKVNLLQLSYPPQNQIRSIRSILAKQIPSQDKNSLFEFLNSIYYAQTNQTNQVDSLN